MITRELFEHYLRATGWNPEPKGGWWTRGSRQIGTFEGMSDYEIGVQISRVAEADGMLPHVLSARLGMCAAAEMSLAFCRKHSLEGSPRGEVIADQARSFLQAAGIDPDTWEATR